MVNTGFISFFVESGGGFDGNGNPIEATKVPTAYIACNIAVVTRKYEIFVDGQWKNASYKVIVEYTNIQKVAGVSDVKPYLFGLTQISLQDSGGNDLGTFQIQNPEFLDMVRKFKVVV